MDIRKWMGSLFGNNPPQLGSSEAGHVMKEAGPPLPSSYVLTQSATCVSCGKAVVYASGSLLPTTAVVYEQQMSGVIPHYLYHCAECLQKLVTVEPYRSKVEQNLSLDLSPKEPAGDSRPRRCF